MKPEKLSDAIGGLDEETVADADKIRNKRNSRPWIRWTALAACLALIVAAVLSNLPQTSAYAIATARYPQMALYPNSDDYFLNNKNDYEGYDKAYRAWYEDYTAQRSQPEGFADGTENYFALSIPQLLSGAEGENRACSPLNIYMALGMLAEITDGNSQKQILDLLGTDNIEALRTQASAIWNSAYRDDGLCGSLLASSIWLRDDMSYKKGPLNQLAKTYYASSYKGKMGSADYNRALQDWINAQTGGLLSDQVGDLGLNSETVIALATTVYFRSGWKDKFNEGYTSPDTFYSPAGELTCDFMSSTDYYSDYYWGEGFSAVSRQLVSDGNMYLILPDEGITPEALLERQELTDFILAGENWANSGEYTVNLSLPKFDICSELDLTESLQALGITDVFNYDISDFSPLTTEEPLFVSRAEHAARVAIDEEGCTAAAYTVMAAAGGDMPPEGEEIDFNLNRPFIFVITTPDGLPMFVGIVNQP